MGRNENNGYREKRQIAGAKEKRKRGEDLLKIDLADTHQVHVAWGCIAEPGDDAIGTACELFGATTALECVLLGKELPFERLATRAGGAAELKDSEAEKESSAPRVAEHNSEQLEATQSTLDYGEPCVQGEWSPVERLRRRWHKVLERYRIRIERLNLDRVLEQTHELGVSILTPGMRQWPQAVNDLGACSPLALWVTGDIDLLHRPLSVAVVGSRDCSEVARLATMELTQSLATRGINVISGGAYGVDAAAHTGALQASGGVTTAVLCGGLDKLYPANNEHLLLEIQRRGVLVSESPPGKRPAAWLFLKRNRLISALAKVTVVAEAAKRSGALNTAHWALELGRGVGALPGSVNSAKCVGTNLLLRDGAHIILGVEDVLDLLGQFLSGSERISWQNGTDTGLSRQSRLEDLKRKGVYFSAIEECVYAALPTRTSVSEHDLSVEVAMSLGEISNALFSLQLAKLVEKQTDGWRKL